MNNNKKILDVLSGKKPSTPPIWLMRQAGRYLPEYRAVRSSLSNFLELCYTPEVAAEVTLQPIRRFGFDAAIIFSDILVIPDALGLHVEFIPSKGPVLKTVQNEVELSELEFNEDKLTPVYQALSIVKKELPKDCTLIGFSGSPWTLATYMVEGGSSKDYSFVRSLAYAEPEFFSKLIDRLVGLIVTHASKQIEAGAEVIQLFDSWAGVLSHEQYRKWVIQPTQKIVNHLKLRHPNVPIIGFPKGSGVLYKEFANSVAVDAVSIDYTVPISWARDAIEVPIQGNLDPLCLQANSEEAVLYVKGLMDDLRNKPFIFNLGHGIVPNTPIEHVERIIEAIRNG